MARDSVMDRDTTTRRRDTAVLDQDANTAVVASGEDDLLNWGAIWAGLLSAFAVFVLLSLAALAAGLTAAPVGDAGDPALGAQIAGILTGLFMVIAFFVGGFVTAWSARMADPEPAILHGFLVWALWIVLLIVFVGLGAGSALGLAAQVFGEQFAAGNAPDPNVNPEELLDTFRDAAWQTLFAMILAVTAAILGALLATRDEVRMRMPRLRWR